VRNDRKGWGFRTSGKGVWTRGGGLLKPDKSAEIGRSVREPRALLCEILGAGGAAVPEPRGVRVGGPRVSSNVW
jgi:hypothetical protein